MIPVITRPLAIKPSWLVKPHSGQGGFTFLNSRKDDTGIDWRSPQMPKLWRYNLHYFDYLHEDERPWQEKAFLINNWIEGNPLGKSDAWEPFPVSLRIVNWIKFFLKPETLGRVDEKWLESLYRQILFLEHNLEYHLLANHFFKNLKALLFAGILFEGNDAKRWLKKSSELIRREIDEQVLSDGGHFERSPMYHTMVLEDCLDLLNVFKGEAWSSSHACIEKLEVVCRRMVQFLKCLSHPDGKIALFNDAAFGIESEPVDIFDYYHRVTGERVPDTQQDFWSFPESGYFVLSPREGDRLIIDCGPIGPDYQPGHGHCDTLSFELSLKGERVVVDSGCYHYEKDHIRDYNRGNLGHNTLTIDGQNQSEVWGVHRCARRARPIGAKLNKDFGDLVFYGAHDGYRRLQGSPIHARRLVWSKDTIHIDDTVDGKGFHTIESRLHIHPSLKVDLIDRKAVISDDKDLRVTISLVGSGSIESDKGWYCPEFGKRFACTVLVSKHPKQSLPFQGGWVLEVEDSSLGNLSS